MQPAFVPLADYLDTDVSVVVSVSWAGRTWRVSDRYVYITGQEEAFPGLSEVPRVDSAIALGTIDAGMNVSVGMVLPIDVKAYVDAGFDLQDVELEVSLVWHKRGKIAHTWAARQVMAQGELTGAQWGQPDKPAGWLAGTLEDSPYRVRKPVLPETARVDADTWASSPDDAAGTFYPRVFGAPVIRGTDISHLPPAIAIKETAGNVDWLIVNLDPCVATAVTIHDDAGASSSYTIEYRTDLLGRRVATVDISGGGISRTAGSYVSDWQSGPATAPFGSVGKPLLVAAQLLAESGADLDLVEWVRVGELFGGSASGFINDPDTDAWEVARDLASSLPIATRRGRDGWAPVITDPALAAGLTVSTWRADGQWRRSSAWQLEGQSRIGAADVASPDGLVTVGASAAYDGPLPHAWVRHLPRLGNASAEVSWTGSNADAYRSAAWLAQTGAMGWEASAWQVPVSWATEREGDWVTLIEDGITTEALILRRTPVGGVWDYTLIKPVGRR